MGAHRMVLKGGTAVLPDGLLEDAVVVIEGERIADILPASRLASGEEVDTSGLLVLPGLVDLHSDAIEREIEPRPRAFFPLEMAVMELERKMAGHGITTLFHAVSLAEQQELGVRSHAVVEELIEAIHHRPLPLIRTPVHLRYEITDREGLSLVRRLVEDRQVRLLSFMDHTPGQGQFLEIEAYRHYMRERYGIDDRRFEELVRQKEEARGEVAGGLEELARFAGDHGVPLASHDDDSPIRVDLLRHWGAVISEFPLTLEAARRAAETGMHVCVGAPNVVRGGSLSGHLGAAEAIRSGLAHFLCSDYHPAALLHAVFRLAADILPLPAAVRMASLNPATAVGLEEEVGSLTPGKQADLILVRLVRNRPVVVATMVAGRWVHSVSFPKVPPPPLPVSG